MFLQIAISSHEIYAHIKKECVDVATSNYHKYLIQFLLYGLQFRYICKCKLQ
jgi:hypothetical protein